MELFCVLTEKYKIITKIYYLEFLTVFKSSIFASFFISSTDKILLYFQFLVYALKSVLFLSHKLSQISTTRITSIPYPTTPESPTLTCALVLEIQVSSRSVSRVLWNLPVVFTAKKMSPGVRLTWGPLRASTATPPPPPKEVRGAALSLGKLPVRNWKST